MDSITFRAFLDELAEIKLAAAKGIAELLANKALRKGITPGSIPAIERVGNIALHNRGRAAEVAGNVRSFLNKGAP